MPLVLSALERDGVITRPPADRPTNPREEHPRAAHDAGGAAGAMAMGEPQMTESAPLPDADADAVARVARLAREQANKVMKKVPLLGTVSWLMLAGVATRHSLLSDLEWRVMPALMLNQAKLYWREEMPVAYVSWARLSPEVERRYQQPPHRLAPAEWRSGEAVWLVDMVAPFGGVEAIMKDLRETTLRGVPIRQLALADEAPAEMITWPAMPE